MKAITREHNGRIYNYCHTCKKWYFFDPARCDKDYMCQPCANALYAHLMNTEVDTVMCARPECENEYEYDPVKKYCSKECQALHYSSQCPPCEDCGQPTKSKYSRRCNACYLLSFKK